MMATNRCCPHCGEKTAILAPEDIPLIWELGLTLTDAEIGAKFDVKAQTIRDVLTLRTWVRESTALDSNLRRCVQAARYRRGRAGRPFKTPRMTHGLSA